MIEDGATYFPPDPDVIVVDDPSTLLYRVCELEDLATSLWVRIIELRNCVHIMNLLLPPSTKTVH